MSYLINRLREPSTWAGLALTVSQAAPAIIGHAPGAITTCLFGLAAILFPEGQKAAA